MQGRGGGSGSGLLGKIGRAGKIIGMADASISAVMGLSAHGKWQESLNMRDRMEVMGAGTDLSSGLGINEGGGYVNASVGISSDEARETNLMLMGNQGLDNTDNLSAARLGMKERRSNLATGSSTRALSGLAGSIPSEIFMGIQDSVLKNTKQLGKTGKSEIYLKVIADTMKEMHKDGMTSSATAAIDVIAMIEKASGLGIGRASEVGKAMRDTKGLPTDVKAMQMAQLSKDNPGLDILQLQQLSDNGGKKLLTPQQVTMIGKEKTASMVAGGLYTTDPKEAHRSALSVAGSNAQAMQNMRGNFEPGSAGSEAVAKRFGLKGGNIDAESLLAGLKEATENFKNYKDPAKEYGPFQNPMAGSAASYKQSLALKDSTLVKLGSNVEELSKKFTELTALMTEINNQRVGFVKKLYNSAQELRQPKPTGGSYKGQKY